MQSVAAHPILDDHLQFDGAIGPTWYHANTGHVVVSPIERDSSLLNGTASTAIYRLGMGYRLSDGEQPLPGYIKDILFQLNWYFSTTTFKGVVWQSGESIFNNYTFRAPITNNRAMLDVKLSILTLHQLSLYPILGIGPEWTQFAYHERVASTDVSANSFVSLNPKTQVNMAYDLGFGGRYALGKHLGVTAEYIFTMLSTVKPSTTRASSLSNVTIVQEPSFSIYDQSLLFGVGWVV